MKGYNILPIAIGNLIKDGSKEVRRESTELSFNVFVNNSQKLVFKQINCMEPINHQFAKNSVSLAGTECSSMFQSLFLSLY